MMYMCSSRFCICVNPIKLHTPIPVTFEYRQNNPFQRNAECTCLLCCLIRSQHTAGFNSSCCFSISVKNTTFYGFIYFVIRAFSVLKWKKVEIKKWRFSSIYMVDSIKISHILLYAPFSLYSRSPFIRSSHQYSFLFSSHFSCHLFSVLCLYVFECVVYVCVCLCLCEYFVLYEVVHDLE